MELVELNDQHRQKYGTQDYANAAKHHRTHYSKLHSWLVTIFNVLKCVSAGSDVFNSDGLNAVDLATVIGAVPLLDQLLNMPDVYRLRHRDDTVVYDITYLAPQTTDRAAPSSSISKHVIKNNSVAPEDASPSAAAWKSPAAAGQTPTFDDATTTSTTSTTGGGGGDQPQRTSKSCLDLIVDMEDEIRAAPKRLD